MQEEYMQEDYKEFTGKNLDDAMAAACSFYGVERGKLEIEIVSDAKGGIFGLVAGKKAIVRARRACLENVPLRPLAASQTPSPPPPPPARAAERGRPAAAREKKAEAARPVAPAAKPELPEIIDPAYPAAQTPQATAAKTGPAADTGRSDPVLESLDQEQLKSAVLEAVGKLTFPIAGETEKTLELTCGKARVRLECAGDAGLLIGREGQTLLALQYLAGCIVSRRMGAPVRVRIDAGDYREKQLEKLRGLALALAAKAKETARPQSTRLLDSYQRRAVHMALQNDSAVQTHSKGEGAMKRVIIAPRQS